MRVGVADIVQGSGKKSYSLSFVSFQNIISASSNARLFYDVVVSRLNLPVEDFESAWVQTRAVAIATKVPDPILRCQLRPKASVQDHVGRPIIAWFISRHAILIAAATTGRATETGGAGSSQRDRIVFITVRIAIVWMQHT